MRRTVAAACIVAALSPAVATAQPKAQVWWLDLGPAAWWDNSSFFATVTVVYGRTYGHDDTYAWGTAYDKRTRYQCGAYYELQPGQFVVDPTFSIAVLDAPQGYCGPVRIVWTSTSAPFLPVHERLEWRGVGEPELTGPDLRRHVVGSGPSSQRGNVGYRQLAATTSAYIGMLVEASVTVPLE